MSSGILEVLGEALCSQASKTNNLLFWDGPQAHGTLYYWSQHVCRVAKRRKIVNWVHGTFWDSPEHFGPKFMLFCHNFQIAVNNAILQHINGQFKENLTKSEPLWSRFGNFEENVANFRHILREQSDKTGFTQFLSHFPEHFVPP